MALKTASTGAFLIPTAPAVGATVTGGAANTFTTNAVQLIASTAAAIYITGIYMNLSSTSKPTYVVIRLSTGAGDGSIVGEYVVNYAYTAGATGTVVSGYVEIDPWIPVATSTRIGAKSADSVGSLGHTVILQCINQANVVDAGINESTDVQTIKTNAVVNGGTVTFPTNATLASTTNITAATGITAATVSDKTGYSLTATTGLGNQTANITGNLSGSVGSVTGAVGSVTGAVGSVTGAVGSVTAGVTVTTNNDKTGYTVSTVSDKTGYALSSAGVQAIWDALTSVLTTVGSIGKLLVTNIDALISSRTKPADTQAAVTLVTTTTNLTNLPAVTTDWLTAAGVKADAVTKIQNGLATPTNITAGTITTVTNLTNAPTAGDFTATMKTSLNAATPAVTVSDKTGFSLTAAYDPAKTAAQAGNQMDLVNAPNATAITAIQSGLSKPGTAQTITPPADMALDSTVAKDATVMKAASYTAPDNADIALIKAKTDQLVFTVANQVDSNALSGGGGLDAAGVRSAIGLASANLDTQLDAIPTAAENAAELLSEATTTPIKSNLKKVNDVTLKGNGAGTPWGPV